MLLKLIRDKKNNLYEDKKAIFKKRTLASSINEI